MLCIIPEYAVGVRAWRVVTSDQFAQPRCLRHAIHGAKIGEWEWRGGKWITHWERITP